MTEQQSLLFELGTEELPPKNLLKLSNALLANMQQGLDKAELKYGKCLTFATPRRLAVLIADLSIEQSDKTVAKRGPAVKVAFAADGTPSKAATGFAKSCGTTVEQLQRLKTDKGEWLAFQQGVKGQSAVALIPEIINHSIKMLPIAKRMRWGDFSSEFVRPVHWSVLLFGSDVIATEILGVKTSNQTYGHRFHAPNAITLGHASEYCTQLYQQGKVIATFDKRKQRIKAQALAAGKAVGGVAIIDDELLDTVTALNEWPVAITGNFDQRYLKLPAEVLITTMQINQKYFPVRSESQALLPYFITFSNIESSRPESIQSGNQRVIMPRLADAEFFWNQDRKQTLAARCWQLEKVVFQRQLGSIAEKSQRLENLAETIAIKLGVNSSLVKCAAVLAKTDLVTDMVGEFASLQGIVGRYYALADGQPKEVAWAIEEQYLPKQSGGALPKTALGQVLSIADKIDTLTGIFSAGLIPTGDQDPYALRRACLGIIRIVIEQQLDLNIIELFAFSLKQFKHSFALAETQKLINEFYFERLKGYCLDHDFSVDEYLSVRAIQPGNPLDFMARLQAVQAFKQLPEAESLVAANKRISNILRKSETKPAANITNLVASQEQLLYQAAQQAQVAIEPLLQQRNYQAALTNLASLGSNVDVFFDSVMVNCEDLTLRTSRLALLNLLAKLFLQIADIACLAKTN